MATKRRSIIEFYDQESPYITEFRRLLHKITNGSSETELKSLMLTSAMLSEGKSTVTSLLGITGAVHKGLKMLIIDGDLRRPSIARFFNLNDQPGLVEILREGYDPRGAIQKTSIDKLDIITSGSHCENPSEVFDAEAIGSLVTDMKFYYDLILVDCPPLVPVSDPMLLASLMDGVLLVVKAGVTQKEVVQRALEIVNPKASNVIGVVLNNMNQSLPFYYNYGYYQYEYVRKPNKSDKAARGGRSESTPDGSRVAAKKKANKGNISQPK